MADKIIVVDTSKCTGCRACQVACKQWNSLPAEVTECRGSYENPPDLSFGTYTRILFNEVEADGETIWYFGQHRCMHCSDAGCVKVCPVPGAITTDTHGAVVINQQLCTGCRYCVFGCPFNVPRYDVKNAEGFGADRAFKCTMCFERQEMGEQPACTKTCPTGALSFRDKTELGEIRTAAGERGLEVYDGGGLRTRVVFLLEGDPRVYGLPAKPGIPFPTFLWRSVMKPLGVAAFVLGVFAAVAHFAYFGPKDTGHGSGGPPPAGEGGEN